jgi:XTP/dITP diphosphohydrolase
MGTPGLRPALRLLVATANEDKAREIRALLGGCGWELVSYGDLGLGRGPAVAEGESYQENAILKARFAAQLTGLVALGEDSGLEVDALGGAPGPLSARYLGEGASYQERFAHILAQLQGVPYRERGAKFRCVMALVEPSSGREWVVEDICTGYIALTPRGEGGFGYDPIFYLPTRAATMAQLSAEEKNVISHRARAAARLRPILKELWYELAGR